MAPETRSRGVPPPSRIYHSTPTYRQTRFATSRRSKSVRTPASEPSAAAASAAAASVYGLRQQTLTQLNFVSSPLDPLDPLDWEVLGDEEDEAALNMARNKELSEPMSACEPEANAPGGSSGKKRSRGVATYGKKGPKRRRTVGDEIARLEEKDEEEDEDYLGPCKPSRKTKKGKGSRRKTLGDTPGVEDPKYHTQTLTQFLGAEGQPIVLDSDDDEADEDFDRWLGKAESDSPTKGREQDKPKRSGRLSKTVLEDEDDGAGSPAKKLAREESLVPQTPTKTRVLEIPSSSQAGSPPSADKTAPDSARIQRYGAAGVQPSPSPLRTVNRIAAGAIMRPLSSTTSQRKLVIEDSTETFALPDTPSKNSTTSNKENETPSSVRSARRVQTGSEESQRTPTRPQRGPSQELGKSTVKKVRISSKTPEKVRRRSPLKALASGKTEIADSEEEDEDESWGASGDGDGSWEPEILVDEDEDEDQGLGSEGFELGADTQAVLSELAADAEEALDPGSPTPTKRKAVKERTPARVSTSQATAEAKYPSGPAGTPAKQTSLPPAPRARLRKPLSRPLPVAISTQLMESQRIPQHLLQAFPQPGIQTDIILPLSSEEQILLADGYTVTVTTAFSLPRTAVRAWLWDGEHIQYGVSLDTKNGRPAERDGRTAWEYDATQMYELNDPWDRQKMEDEDIPLHIPKFRFLPPGLASGMMWNLQRALFMEEALGIYAEELGELESSQAGVALPPPSSTSQHHEAIVGDAVGHDGTTASEQPSQTASLTVSQEVQRQLQSDAEHSSHFPTSEAGRDSSLNYRNEEEDDHGANFLVPSTPDAEEASQIDETPWKGETPRVRPSQATTASQASTPGRPSPRRLLTAATGTSPAIASTATTSTATTTPRFTRYRRAPATTTSLANHLETTHHQQPARQPALPPQESSNDGSSNGSSSLHFQEYTEPSPLGATSLAGASGVFAVAQSSPFEGVSQLLPDSLVEREEDDEQEIG